MAFRGSTLLPSLTRMFVQRRSASSNPNPLGLPASQPSVFSQGKKHDVSLWIELNPIANAKEVGKVMSQLQMMVDQIIDPSTKNEENDIWAGVGFGPTFLKQVGGEAKQDFTYTFRRGAHGEMPISDGDVIVHAKCNTHSKLFELVQLVLKKLPTESVKTFEDIYGFVYKGGRDLTGFIDGTENPHELAHRQRVAVEKETGGSYVITQKWIHDFDVINNRAVNIQESWVGRRKSDSAELRDKPITSHVARITGGNGFQQPKTFEIVRQPMPFGTMSDKAGLFFVAYSASPDNFNFMLDRMVGAQGDQESDQIMKFTKNVKGTFWYFPGVDQLKKLA